MCSTLSNACYHPLLYVATGVFPWHRSPTTEARESEAGRSRLGRAETSLDPGGRGKIPTLAPVPPVLAQNGGFFKGKVPSPNWLHGSSSALYMMHAVSGMQGERVVHQERLWCCFCCELLWYPEGDLIP